MRRSDRELTTNEAIEILKEGEYGVLSTICEDGSPYGVPISYVYAEDENAIYFHSTNGESLKVSNIQKDARTCFTVVGSTQVLPDKFGTLYQSCIVKGKVEILDNSAAMQKGLIDLLHKYSEPFMEAGLQYMKNSMAKVAVLKMKDLEITGKARKK